MRPRQQARRLRTKRAELARLVAAGTLKGTGSGTRLRIEAGSYCAWRGEPVPVVPQWGRAYAVFPDEEREEVERQQAGCSVRSISSASVSGPQRPLPRHGHSRAYTLDVCQRLARGGTYQPFIMVIGDGDLEDRVRALDAGADDYVPKPFDADELLARTRRLIHTVRGAGYMRKA